MSLESVSAADVISAAHLYRLYNSIAKKYFREGELPPSNSRELAIIASPLIVQQKIGSQYVRGIDANGLVTTEQGIIHLFVNPFFVRYPRLLYMTMAHEMIHVHAHWQYKLTNDLSWIADGHGVRFHKMVATLIGRGLTGIKPSQDIAKIPHSYPVVCAHDKQGGYHFLRLDFFDELNDNIIKQLAVHCDTSKPLYVGEMNTSIVSIFPFVIKNKIVGDFFSYLPDAAFQMDSPRKLDWPKD